jgi:AcrR family transcriptional regulator
VASAKALFSRRGYESASTSAIATQAKTSESQLMRLFGGKSGLLDAIFNDTWLLLNGEISARLHDGLNGREAVQVAFEVVSEGFAHDPEAATLFLFEGRRIRSRGTQVAASQGSLEFIQMFRSLVARGQADGSFRSDLSDSAITSALIGAGEGMLRDRLIALRHGLKAPFDDATIAQAFAAAASGFVPK